MSDLSKRVVPPPPLPRPLRIHTRLIDLWFAAQVELHGHYSIERLRSLHAYEKRTPMWRVVLVAAFTPALAVILINSTDAIPLEAPSKGLSESLLMWVRTYFSIVCIAGPTLLQLRIIVPRLRLTRLHALLLTLVASAAAVGGEITLAKLIGYPVPFGLILGTPACFTTLVVGLIAPRWKELMSSPALRQDLVDYVQVWVCQVGFTVMYPVYNYVFSQLSSFAQTAFALVLPVMKLVNRNWISHMLRNADDVKPELVVFNVEVFHAMYTSVCMQQSTSPITTLTIMLVDFLQAWLSIRDVDDVLNSVSHLIVKVPPKGQPVCAETLQGQLSALIAENESLAASHSSDSRHNLMELAIDILKEDPQLCKHRTLQQKRSPVDMNRKSLSVQQTGSNRGIVKKKSSRAARKYTVTSFFSRKRAIVAASSGVKDERVGLTADERLLVVQKALHLAFLTEFVALVEYAEVLMPAIYNACVRGMIVLPNREFYSLLAGKSDAQLQDTVNSVAVYGSLEFLSCVLFCMTLRWRVRYSVLAQIAFVLEKQFVMVQSKLVMWVFYIIQSSLYHFGADYSFAFSWLHTGQ